jgi:hypothetical protein
MSDVVSVLEKFYTEKLWVSPEALEASKNSDMQNETDESEDSRSCTSKTSSTMSEDDDESSLESDSSVDLPMPVFKKKFKNYQLYLWARLRTRKTKRDRECLEESNDIHNSQCIATTKDFRKIIGSIDVLADNQGYLRKNCAWEHCAWIVDPYAQGFLSCEYFHELVMGLTLRETLSDIPVFSRAFLQLADLDKKQLHFSKVGGKIDAKELDMVIHDLQVEELHSIVFQVLVSICIAQKRVKLKHHDLHLGNIMVTPREQSSNWEADTPVGIFNVPLIGYDATLIDFGLSSCEASKGVQLSRLDSDLLSMGDSGTSSASNTSDIGKSWGIWDPDLEGDTGYDFCMFVESIIDTVVQERPLNIKKLTFLSEVQKFSQAKCTGRNRPETKSIVHWSEVFNKFLVQGKKTDLD